MLPLQKGRARKLHKIPSNDLFVHVSQPPWQFSNLGQPSEPDENHPDVWFRSTVIFQSTGPNLTSPHLASLLARGCSTLDDRCQCQQIKVLKEQYRICSQSIISKLGFAEKAPMLVHSSARVLHEEPVVCEEECNSWQVPLPMVLSGQPPATSVLLVENRRPQTR